MWQQADDGTHRTWQEACDYCDNLNHANHSDWRIPDRRELVSIVDYGRNTPAINPIFDCGRLPCYWSGSISTITSGFVWTVGFMNGVVDDHSENCYNDFYVRCVRGKTGPNFIFQDNGDGTVSDLKTGLMWQQADDGTHRTWQEALNFCECLNLAGHSDWRLPSIRELESIVDWQRHDPAIDPVFDCRTGIYWSGSTKDYSPGNAWFLTYENIADGVIADGYKYLPFLVRCVRGGPVERPGCYTVYDFDTGPFYNYDMTVRWDEAPSTGCIYPAFQFWFQVGQGGYMGTQLNGSNKTAIFSIWDTFSTYNATSEKWDGNETAQPAHTNCGRFDWEGTGTRCIMNYDWQIGYEYRLSISSNGTDDTGKYWKGTIYDTVNKKETVIGIIHLKNQKQYTGYGWLINQSQTFLEYFCGTQTCLGHPYSKVTWRGPYADERAFLADYAKIKYKPCPTNNITTKGRPLTIHEAGDGVERTTPPGQLWHNQPTVPDIIVSPVELNFGSVNIGSSSNPELITVTNDGIVDLEIGQSTLAGANEGDFSIQNDNCSNQIISPDSSRSLEVIFSPISVGSKTATLIVPSNDSDENPVTVSLIGTGMPSGDANGDADINVQDVICIINCILDPTFSPAGNPDCNKDRSVNVQDVICVINKILGG